MKNITVSIDEQTYRSARIRATELDTSVSALVGVLGDPRCGPCWRWCLGLAYCASREIVLPRRLCAYRA